MDAEDERIWRMFGALSDASWRQGPDPGGMVGGRLLKSLRPTRQNRSTRSWFIDQRTGRSRREETSPSIYGTWKGSVGIRKTHRPFPSSVIGCWQGDLGQAKCPVCGIGVKLVNEPGLFDVRCVKGCFRCHMHRNPQTGEFMHGHQVLKEPL